MNSYLKKVIENKNWGLLDILINNSLVDKSVLLELSCEDIYNIVKNIPNLRSTELDNKILKWGSSRLIYQYSLDIASENELFKQELIKRGKIEYIFNYAKYVIKSHDIDIYNALFKGEVPNYSYLYDYVALDNAPLEEIINLAINNYSYDLIEYLKLEKIKDYPKKKKKLFMRLTNQEIIELIIYLDNALFNFKDTYLLNYRNDIALLANKLSYIELYYLLTNLNMIQIIDLINPLLKEKEKGIETMDLDELFETLTFLNKVNDLLTIDKYNYVFAKLFDNGLVRTRNLRRDKSASI